MVLYVLQQGAYHELFSVFGEFYVSGTQDAEVTKSLMITACLCGENCMHSKQILKGFVYRAIQA